MFTIDNAVNDMPVREGNSVVRILSVTVKKGYQEISFEVEHTLSSRRT